EDHRWLQGKASYTSGKVELTFSQEISNHIKDVVNNSGYRLEQATQLRSQHSIRLFEILHHTIDPDTQEGEWIVSLEEIKKMFEIEGQYPRWVDFKKRVIEESVNQLNKNTSLKVTWEIAEKCGRSVDKLRFTAFESSQLALSF